ESPSLGRDKSASLWDCGDRFISLQTLRPTTWSSMTPRSSGPRPDDPAPGCCSSIGPVDVGSGGAGFLPLSLLQSRAVEAGLISVDDAGLRMRWIAESLAEQTFGRRGIAQRRQQEVDSGTGGIDGP